VEEGWAKTRKEIGDVGKGKGESIDMGGEIGGWRLWDKSEKVWRVGKRDR